MVLNVTVGLKANLLGRAVRSPKTKIVLTIIPR